MEDQSEISIKKPAQILYWFLFVVFILAPVVVFILVYDDVDTQNYEERTLAAFPYSEESYEDGVATTYDTFASEFESWFDDHLPFRNQLLSMYGQFEYRVLKSSTSDSVIVGKEGWLFYKGEQVNDEDPIGDYRGTDLLTEEELETIASNLTHMRDELEKEDCKFYVYIAPNKERVYSEYMPDMYGEPTEYGTIHQLTEYLKENTDLQVVCGLDDIMTFKEENPDIQLYYKYDTHWNGIGAYVGAEELMQTMDYTYDEFEELTISTQEYANYDLARLLHLQNVLTDDTYYLLSDYTPHDMSLSMEDDGLVIRYHTSDGSAPGEKLVMIGDSFATMLMPYVACHFINSYMTYYYHYSYEDLMEEEPSEVVFEVVERYIGNLVDFTLEDGYQGDVIE